jgi:hypothetical protein
VGRGVREDRKTKRKVGVGEKERERERAREYKPQEPIRKERKVRDGEAQVVDVVWPWLVLAQSRAAGLRQRMEPCGDWCVWKLLTDAGRNRLTSNRCSCRSRKPGTGLGNLLILL